MPTRPPYPREARVVAVENSEHPTEQEALDAKRRYEDPDKS
ncbi:MAG: hypothetical protein E7J32_12490 [Klebsiella grimontii]|nr:hypothetical protein [Klebsiella grimontii]